MRLDGELRQLLEPVSSRGASPWSEVVALLARAFPESVGLFYDLAAKELAPRVNRITSSLPMPGGRELIDQSLHAEGRYGFYRPLLPEPEQRNRTVLLTELASAAESERWRWAWRRWNMERSDQVRVLVCDGALMLAWVGLFRPAGRFTDRDRARLQSLVPVIRDHLRWEARLRDSWLREGVEACLESLARPAALVDGAGRVLTANGLLPSSRAAGLADALRAARLGVSSRYEFKQVRSSGPTCWLALERSPQRLTRMPGTLTRREREVLLAVATGHSNRAVAVSLGISERTVEAHVARLLAKTGCESRAALVAACLRAGT